MSWYHSIRWKLAFSYIALSVVLLLTFYFIVMNSIETYHIDGRVSELETEAIILANYVAGRHGLTNLEHEARRRYLQGSIHGRGLTLGLRILVIDDYARVLADSNTGAPRVGQTMLRHEVINALNGNDTYVLIRDEYVLNVAVSIHDVGSDRVGAVLLVASVEDIFQSIAEMRNDLMLATLLVGILSIVLVLILSNHLIAPLKRTVNIVRRMSTGQLSLRIPVSGRDEYAILAKAFNKMTAKLEQVEQTREEFVSNVSHEMKTPLSAIKVLSESILLQDTAPEEMYREFLQDINSEVDRMTNITNDLLALVKVDQGQQGLNITRLDLNLLVEEILKRLSPLAEQKNIALIYEAERPVQINADEIKLSLAISNIVENGIKYTPKGGTVRVTVDSDYQFALITIQDTGIGIPEEEQDKIFNRFYRVDKTRHRETGGTGLGLSISRATVLLHDGSISINSVPDQGSIFVIRLPLRM
ncbi:MAG: cell wall metabolism sensor histidine kinase WalK [Firmicutes bacterium]|nr:cell wall metabolism sensor histidine kinase WalK [Bacillota bacterium]